MTNYAVKYWMCNIRDILHDLNITKIPDNLITTIIREFLADNKKNLPLKSQILGMNRRLGNFLTDSQFDLILAEITNRATLPKHLLNPFSTVSFGQTDNISIMLSDDFDAVTWMLEEPEIPVKQSCVAFCPDLNSLGIDTQSESSPFFQIEEFFLTSFRENETTQKSACFPHFEESIDKPLVAVTYFRTSGLCNLGSGLLWQEAIIREASQRIRSTIHRLRVLEKKSELLMPGDSDNFKCSFLWPIGWSDLCMISLASNYTVIMSILHNLRNMTFLNLFQATKNVYGKNSLSEDINLELVAKEFSVHECIVNIENIYRKKNPIKSSNISPQLLQNNHVFCSSVTTLGVELNAFMNFFETKKGEWNGFVSADPRFNVSPGHLKSLINNDKTKKGFFVIKNKSDIDVKHWFSAGQYDASKDSCFYPENLQVFPFSELLKCILLLRGEKNDTGNHRLMWPIQDLMTEVYVPILLTENDKQEHINHVNMYPLLAEIRKRVFLRKGKDAELALDILQEKIKYLQIPSPLSTFIVNLYSDFARSLSDPFLFDNVLDLYDLFRAVYRVLTEEMPQKLNALINKCIDNATIKASRRMTYMSENKIHEITVLVNLMENALQRRTQMGFRQAQRWHEALDMRGGYNRLVNAADVPLKCGLSILRRIMMGHVKEIYNRDDLKGEKDEEDIKKRHHFRARLGGASKIAHNSTAIIRRFQLGNEKKNYIVDMGLNIAHLTRPGFLVTHLHETGHLLIDLIRYKISNKEEYYRKEECSNCLKRSCFRYRKSGHLSEWDKETRERQEEIFSEMFTFGLLWYNMEHEEFAISYLRFYLGMFFLNERGMNIDSYIALKRFAEVAIRGFFAIHPWIITEEEKKEHYTLESDYSKSIDIAKEKFVTLIEEAGPMHYEFRRFWKGDNRKYILDKFDLLYSETYKPVCCIWKDVKEIVTVICNPLSSDGEYGTNPHDDELHSMIDQITKAYNEGRPIVRFLYSYTDWYDLNDKVKKKRHRDQEKRKHLDAVFVMRHILRAHIEGIFKDIDISKETCLSDALEFSKSLNKQLLYRLNSGLISIDFNRRKEYLLQRASVLTTLWDISTSVRGRIMRRILQAHFPEVLCEENKI